MKDTEKSTNMQEKKRLRLYVTAALLALTLVITSAWAVSLYANYRAGVNGGDEARVAKFVVETAADSANPTKITLDQIATADGETLTYNAYGDYKFTVKNSNESGVTEVATAIGRYVPLESVRGNGYVDNRRRHGNRSGDFRGQKDLYFRERRYRKCGRSDRDRFNAPLHRSRGHVGQNGRP